MRYDDSGSDTEKEYEFVRGRPLEIDIDGVEKAKLTGEVLDSMFSSPGRF